MKLKFFLCYILINFFSKENSVWIYRKISEKIIIISIRSNKYIYVNNYIFLLIREYAVQIKEIRHINLVK